MGRWSGRYRMMAQNSTETVVSCGVCSVKLSEDEVRFLWTDVDFLQHGDHYVSIRPEDEPTYWEVAKSL